MSSDTEPTGAEPEAAIERRRANAAREAHRRHDERWRGYATEQQRAHEQALADAEARRADLAAALADLERATRSLIRSRRWALASRLGDLRDRLGRGRDPGKEQRRVEAALTRAAVARRRAAEAGTVAGPVSGPGSGPGTGPGTGPKARSTTAKLPAPPPVPPGAEPAGTRAIFADLGGYLRSATTDPILPAPYDEPARRVIGAMDSLRRVYLRAAARTAADGEASPLVSVVLAAHGTLEDLAAAAAGVTAQTYTAWELVLAGPQAERLAVALGAHDGRIRVVPCAGTPRGPDVGQTAAPAETAGTAGTADAAPVAPGPGAAGTAPGIAGTEPAVAARWADHAAALAAAEGRFVTYLDDRTRWEPDRLAVLVHLLSAPSPAAPSEATPSPAAPSDAAPSDATLPRPRLVYAAEELTATATPAAGDPTDPADHPDHADHADHALVGIRFAPYHRALLENRGTLALTAVVHDRSLTDEHGGPDPSFGAAAGWELLLRLTAHAEVTAVPCLLARTDVTGRGGVAELARHADLLEHDPEAPPAPEVAAVDARHLGPVLELPGAEAVLGDAQLHALPTALRRAGRPRPTTVVIPSYQAPDELALCLGSLLACSPREHLDIVVVDNASDADTQAVLDQHVAAGTIELHRNDRNLGFTQAVNQGILAAGDRDVVLLNNDAVVTPGWLEGLWAALDVVDDAGLVVPRHTLLPGSLAARSHVPCADISREIDVNLSILHANVLDPDPALPDGLTPLSFAPFFAVYVPRRTIDEVGLLNVEHGPHYRSDRLYCDTVRHGARRPIVYTPASKLYHLRRRSTRTLKRTDPALYEAMYVFNDWQRISGGRPAAG